MDKKKKIYGYARETVIKNDTIDIQKKSLNDNGTGDIITDQFNGKNRDKPNLENLLIKLDKEDTLIIARLDIIADSTKEAYNTLLELHKKGVIINILDMGIIDDTVIGEAILNTIKAFTVFENNIRTKHLQEGRTRHRRNIKYKDGRKSKYTKEQINEALEMLKSNTYDKVVEKTGIPKSTLYRYNKVKIENVNKKLEDYYKEVREECIKMLEDVGIEVGEITSWETFSKNSKSLGWCKKNKEGTFTIAIREQLFDNEKVSREDLMDTILHELIHAEKNYKGHGHGKNFQAMAKKVNEEYGLNIATHDKTRSWQKEYKLVWLCHNCGYPKKRDNRGEIICPCCNNTKGTFFKSEDFEKFKQLYEDNDYIDISLISLNDEIYSVPTPEELEKIMIDEIYKDEDYHGEHIYKTRTGYNWKIKSILPNENPSGEINIQIDNKTEICKANVWGVNKYSEEHKNS